MKLEKLALVVVLGTAIALPFAANAQQAKGKGAGYGFNADNTRGWGLMTPAERTEHQKKMFAAKTTDECIAARDEHHKLMEARAKEKGTTLGTPKANPCDQMKARGMIQ